MQERNYKESLLNASNEVRCGSCHKLLAKRLPREGAFSIKCPRCHGVVPIPERMGDCVVLVDADATIVCADHRLESVGSHRRDEVVGKPLTVLAGQSPELSYRDILERSAAQKEAIVVLAPHAKLNVVPLFGPQNEVKYVVGVRIVGEH
jgi:LSD1 subclass zinc finger protein